MDAHQQVNLILLDFCKAFDSRLPCCLLKKLTFYHIDDQTINRIKVAYITRAACSTRCRIILIFMSMYQVCHGVCTILGPLVFLIYINHVVECVLATEAICQWLFTTSGHYNRRGLNSLHFIRTWSLLLIVQILDRWILTLANVLLWDVQGHSTLYIYIYICMLIIHSMGII